MTDNATGKRILGVISAILPILLVYIFEKSGTIYRAVERYEFAGVLTLFFIIIPIICLSFYMVMRAIIYREGLNQNLGELVWVIVGIYLTILTVFVSILWMGLQGMID